ncbi:MAG TPA: DUF4097 family beta strand repeat-containing protein [Thermoanaerobaculia bacterium]|nr:DUF4097 family beta strand repeat-containing protein [Thermoanaerobaculia bacterium]
MSDTFPAIARQTGMNTETTMTPATPRPISRGWTVLWILLIGTFLLVSLAWPVRADRLSATASRTDTFGVPAGVKSLSIDGVSGDVEVTAGPTFSATVDVTVKADGEAKAKEILGQTKISFENRTGELSLATLEPGATLSRDGNRTRLHVSGDGGRRWRVEARYRVTLPAGASLEVSLVNGGVKTSGLDGVQELTTVNGRVVASGARRNVMLKTVNGSVEGVLAALASDAKVVAETVNGSVMLTLPADAAFDLKASSINGGIRSTFPLPMSGAASADEDVARAAEDVARADAERARAAADRSRAKAERSRGGTKGEDDEWDREWEEFGREMASFGREMARFGREISRSVDGSLNRSYEGAVKGGGASVRCSTVNGGVLVLAAGTTEATATSLVPRKPAKWAVAPVPPVPPMPPVPPVPPVGYGHGRGHDEGSIVKGDVAGDFSATLPTGDVKLGNVSGRVTVRTSSGDVKIASAGKGADLSSSGGDVKIDRVEGGLTVSTLGGDIVVGDVSGETKLRTMGGDVKLRSAKGPISAKTAGGDLRLLRVAGSVRAETAGGEVYCEIVSKDAGTVELSTGGGDVTLFLPANFKADVEVIVRGVDADGNYVVSEFPEIAVLTHRSPGVGVVRAEGRLNGGGSKVSISAASGTIHLRKGPPA